MTLKETNKIETVSVNVVEVKLFRGSAYTYRLVVIFNDNDKIIEYTESRVLELKDDLWLYTHCYNFSTNGTLYFEPKVRSRKRRNRMKCLWQ